MRFFLSSRSAFVFAAFLGLFIAMFITTAATEALAQGSSRSKSRQKSQAKPKVEVPWSQRAAQELMVTDRESTQDVLPTPATVRSMIEPVANPIQRPGFEAGVSLQPFQPGGRMELSGLDAYELGGLQSRPMIALELRLLAFSTEKLPAMDWGLFASAGFARHSLNLSSPSGLPIERTELNSFKIQAGFEGAWRPPHGDGWSLHGRTGLGRWMSVQSSSSAYANASSNLEFISLGTGVEKRLARRWSGFLNYDYRIAYRGEPSEIKLQRDNILAGIMGGF